MIPWQAPSRKRLLHVAIVPPGETSAALRPLPVEALRLEEGAVDLLHQLGIYQIGQLEQLPRADLSARFGLHLLERWDQAAGRLAEPTVAHPLPPELEVEQPLEYPTARRETIEFILEQLTGRLSRLLIRCGRGALRVECRLDCRPGGGMELSVGLFHPTASARHLFELLRMQLERARLPAPVSAVRVRAAATAPFERMQQELFAGGRWQKGARRLGGLVDRLSSRLGRGAVLRPRLVADAQPEWACRLDPLVTGRSGRRVGRKSTGPVSGADVPPRPLRLTVRPVALAAVSIMPDGPPLKFHFRGREHRVVHTRGPERIETGWWRGRPVRRDYYRVETVTGRRFWLFRDLGDGRWFLHGTFE